MERALGAALLVGAAAMTLRFVLDRRGGHRRSGAVHDIVVRPLPTIAIGMLGGIIVGITSVGSGSLIIVLLLFAYPLLGANQLVGTDLTQAVPLTGAAALGALAFGHVEFSVTTSIIVGSVPAVLVGSFLSSRAPDRIVRPIITFVILASGLEVRWSEHHDARLGPVRCRPPCRGQLDLEHATVEERGRVPAGGNGFKHRGPSRDCAISI